MFCLHSTQKYKKKFNEETENFPLRLMIAMKRSSLCECQIHSHRIHKNFHC